MDRVTCPVACPGMEIEPGVVSGCSCYENKLANGQPIPVGFVCDCPHHPKSITEAQGDKRQAFLESLYEKATTALLTRTEAFTILQGTLAGMLTDVIPEISKDAEGIPDGFEKENAKLMARIATELRQEMLAIVDHAMSGKHERRVLVVADDMRMASAVKRALER